MNLRGTFHDASESPAARRWVGICAGLLLLEAVACTSRAPHIRAPGPPDAAVEANHASVASAAEEGMVQRLRMPPSRARVLEVLSRLQSAMISGEPPLDDLLSPTATLTTPTIEIRRGPPNRSTIAGALGSSFVDTSLGYDPLEVAVRTSDQGTVVSIPLEAASGATVGRRLVLALEVGYDNGELRIRDLSVLRSP